MSLIGSIVSGVGSLVGGIAGASASKSAANTQSDAAKYAADLQNQQYQQTRTDLQPFTDFGKNNITSLQSLLNNPALTQGFYYDKFNAPAAFTAPTAAQAQATPGYQFTLDQGLKSTQNSAAARGLGTSGAALKGAANYATGLADSTYNDVFNRALQSYNTNFNTSQSAYNTNYNSALGQYNTNQSTLGNQISRLSGAVSMGQNSAAQTGSLGQQAATNQGNMLTSAANATASGTVGGANALTSALNGVGSNAMLYGLAQNNAGGGSGTGASGLSTLRANLSSDPIASLNASQGWTV
jgi:hypothetical protein